MCSVPTRATKRKDVDGTVMAQCIRVTLHMYCTQSTQRGSDARENAILTTQNAEGAQGRRNTLAFPTIDTFVFPQDAHQDAPFVVVSSLF